MIGFINLKCRQISARENISDVAMTKPDVYVIGGAAVLSLFVPLKTVNADYSILD